MDDVDGVVQAESCEGVDSVEGVVRAESCEGVDSVEGVVRAESCEGVDGVEGVMNTPHTSPEERRSRSWWVRGWTAMEMS